jgi:hypothetical protein
MLTGSHRLEWAHVALAAHREGLCSPAEMLSMLARKGT